MAGRFQVRLGVCIVLSIVLTVQKAQNMAAFHDFKDINNFVDHGGMPLPWSPYPYEPAEQDFVDPALQGFMPDPSSYVAHAHHHPEAYNH